MNIEQKKLDYLKKILVESKFTVVLCGSGLVKESGNYVLKSPEKAYDIEEKYGVSPEEIFTTVYYHNRTAKFFDFYRQEILKDPAAVTETVYALKRMEDAGMLQCIIDSNMYEQPQRGGCKNVISLHGSIYRSQCPHCGKKYPMEYIRDSKGIPRCEDCGKVIRPGVLLFGELMDSQVMAAASKEIEKADTLILLGTTMESEVFAEYIRYFEGTSLVIIHNEKHFLDEKADLVFLEEPCKVLKQLKF